MRRWLYNLPDNGLVNFVYGMGFFVAAGIALLAISYAVMLSYAVHPLTLIGWGWAAYKLGRWVIEK